MPSNHLTRIEFSMLPEDAELLQRYAAAHGMPVADVVRQALYAQNPVLARIRREREERTYREVAERRQLAQWTGASDGEKRATNDRVIRKLPNAAE